MGRFDFTQQGAVNAGHHQPGFLAALVGRGQQAKSLFIQFVCAGCLVTHQGLKARRVLALQDVLGFDLKLLQLVDGQVNAPAHRVLAHVADDVGELESQAQGVGVGGGLVLALSKNACRHFAHHTGHQMAVALETRVVEVTGLGQVHLAAFNHRQQMAGLDAKFMGAGHERLHHRVLGRACKGALDFGLPPSQLGRRHAWVGHFIDHIIDFTAKSVKGGDRGTAVRR